MSNWYIDRSKNFIYDTLLNCLKLFYSVSKDKESLDVSVLIQLIEQHPELNIADGNINAALTRFRDHGLLRNNNIIGDSAIDYVEGRLSESELIVDLFLKRPASKSNSVNVKPFVLLCKVFDIMIDMVQDVDDIFITSNECKEYLFNINDINDITYEYVEKIINDRNYSFESRIPLSRINLDANEDTKISIWFNALNSTPIFIKKEDSRRILRPNIKQKEFFKYISVNSDEFSVTPTNSNTDLYNYYCDRSTGINEILPNVVQDGLDEIEVSDIKAIFEYLFGYKRDFTINYKKYFNNECFGIFFPFITLPGLAIRKIYMANEKLGQYLYEYVSNQIVYDDYLRKFDEESFEFNNSAWRFFMEMNAKEIKEDAQMKEDFKNWLIKEGFASATIQNYVSSISITTKEGIEDRILDKPIYNIDNSQELNSIIKKLTENEKFIFRKNNYNNINTAALNNYLKFLENRNIECVHNNLEKYSKDDFLKEVFIDEDKYDSLVSILEKKKNIILEGAPGVGKTFMAKRLAYSIIGSKDNNKVKLIQFHQSYSYEDFIEGYRATEFGFELQKGIFYKFCKEAEKDLDNNYYIIIDEINRGNLSKIFGELLMLIESDKRGESLVLAYSEEDFSVPENLYIIGLMNTADRSLALIDYALRRRFSFIRIEPAFDSEKFRNAFKEKFDSDYDNIIEIIKKINEAIEKDQSLGSGFKIGHSYFCPNLKDRKGNKKDILDIIRFEIVPLLEEYWYDDEDSLITWKDALTGVIDD